MQARARARAHFARFIRRKTTVIDNNVILDET